MPKNKHTGPSMKADIVKQMTKPIDTKMKPDTSGKNSFKHKVRHSPRDIHLKPLLPQRYFREPEYGDWTPLGGASSMDVMIGPMQALSINQGHSPDPNTPGIMRELLDEHPSFGWVAGHLLNDNLGGPGKAKNLTPLTTAGNKNHLNACETTIKNYIDKAHGRVEFYPKDPFWYGVAYSVRVNPIKWGGERPWNLVPISIFVSVRAVTRNKKSGETKDLSPVEDPAGLYLAPMVDFEVFNDGWEAS